MVGGALGAPHGVDAAVHHGHADPVAGNAERRSLAPLVGHGVVAAEGAGLRVGAAAGLERQVPAADLDSPVGEGGGRGLEERISLISETCQDKPESIQQRRGGGDEREND